MYWARIIFNDWHDPQQPCWSQKVTPLRGLRDRLMREGHVIGNAVPSILINAGDIHQEAGCHADQSLSRPCVKPVKHCAVDEGWKLASPDAEFVAHRAEAQHHMQVSANLVDEEVPAVLGGVDQPRGLHFIPDCIAEVVLVLLYIVHSVGVFMTCSVVVLI